MSQYSRERAERAIKNIERQLMDILPTIEGQHDEETGFFLSDLDHYRLGWLQKTIELARDELDYLREAMKSESS